MIIDAGYRHNKKCAQRCA